MKQSVFRSALALAAAASLQASDIVVTTPAPAGAGSLAAALSSVQDGDVIKFNIAGPGPHVIQTPAGGYPLITKHNVTIDGYSQPGAVPNTNPILSSNNAQIKIVLDSRNGNSTVMDFAGDTPNDDTGYGSGESAILGVLAATNVTIKGLSLVAVPQAPGDVSLYGISFAKGANGQVAGCWIGVTPEGQSGLGYGPVDGITGFRYRGRDEANTVTNTILVSGLTIGVGKGSSDPRSEFNVITSIPAIPMIIEGENLRIAGNFIEVHPSGVKDYNPAFEDPNVVPPETYEGAIEIGRAGNNTIIGVDGDGVNDAEERNVIGGTVPPSLGGYDHTLEFYGQTPGTNVVVAGNYIGIGVDGTTRFTNAVPALNASGGSAEYRFGSNFDGVSDELEGNVVYNNWPEGVVALQTLADAPQNLNFFDELSTGASISYRGNVLVNNFPLPVSPAKLSGADSFLTNYYAKVYADVNAGLAPVVNASSTTVRLVGTVPVPGTNYVGPVVVDVYVPDTNGIVTGEAVNALVAPTPEFPDGVFPEGWVQSRQYLGSFTLTNAATGSFDVSVSGWNIPTNTAVTVVANYTSTNAVLLSSPFSAPVVLAAGTTGDITMGTVTVSGSDLVLTWSGGTPPYQVQRRADLNPATTWQNEGSPTGTNSATVPITGDQGYFRVTKP
jgi:hypothetical protein